MPPRPASRVGQHGQILIPSLFVIPSLVLFVFLIVETGKLSREKIRHQFAVDSASFIEMTNYSEFLSRSAYVNGAFPQRIFAEGFLNTMIDRKNNTSPKSLYDILWEAGDFPGVSRPGSDPNSALDTVPVWPIQFGGCGTGKNANPPNMSSCGSTGGKGGSGGGGGAGAAPTGNNNELDIITYQNAIDYWLSWDDANDIYNLYVQIYTLLGQVEDAQFSVWQRLSGTQHSFFRKSYFLNTLDNAASSDPGEGAAYFNAHPFDPKAYCVQQLMFYGNKPSNNPFEPYIVNAPQEPIKMNSTMSTSPNACSPNGLFHLETVPQADLNAMDEPHDTTGYPGYNVVQHYTTGMTSNYFNINFAQAMNDPICGSGSGPCVHATINLSGGQLWPNPTPKYQTRLYP